MKRGDLRGVFKPPLRSPLEGDYAMRAYTLRFCNSTLYMTLKLSESEASQL